MSNYLWPHELQHARLPCPSLSPRIRSDSCPLSQWCHLTISSSVSPFSSCLQSFPASGGIFQWVSSSHQVAKILELQLQYQSFQWIFKIDFLWDWLVWSCCPRDSQESSPEPQFKSISSLVLSLLWASLEDQLIRNLPATWETWVWSLGWEYPLEKEMAAHSSILAWRLPWIV